MRRLLGWCCLVLLPLFALSDEKKLEPNTLTPKEIQDGWLLLFDGETTFGWKITGEAKVEKGVLVLGGEKETRAEPSLQLTGAAVSMETDWQGEKPPVIEWSNFFRPSIPLAKTAQGKFTPHNNSISGADLKLQPVSRFVVPAGSKLLLRNVKCKPLGETTLFNGKNLDGWKMLEMKGKKSDVTVTKEGWLNIKNGPGDLQSEKTFSDFVLQLECISNGKHLNSGLFFRALPGKTWAGYEAQIRNQLSPKADQKYTVEEYDPTTNKLAGKKTFESNIVDYGTGAIYRRVPARKMMAKDGEWFTLTVAARGRHIATWVNGVQVVDWTDNRPANENGRNGYRAEAGALSLQGHDPTTDLSFRNLRIVNLAAKK